MHLYDDNNKNNNNNNNQPTSLPRKTSLQGQFVQKAKHSLATSQPDQP
jgi:hypothetical protein